MATAYQLKSGAAVRPLKPSPGRESAAESLTAREHQAAARAERRGVLLEADASDVCGPGVRRSYMLTDARTRAVVAQGSSKGYGLSIDQIEEYLRACGWR